MNSVLTGKTSAPVLSAAPRAPTSQPTQSDPNVEGLVGLRVGSETVMIELSASLLDRLQPFWEAGLDVEAIIEVSCRTFLLAGWVFRSPNDPSDTIKVSVVLPTIVIDELVVRSRFYGQSLSGLVDYAIREWLRRIH